MPEIWQFYRKCNFRYNFTDADYTHETNLRNYTYSDKIYKIYAHLY